MILNQTLTQFLIMLKIASAGIFSVFLIYLFKFFYIKNKKFNFVNKSFEFLLYLLIFFTFYFSNLFFNFGDIRPIFVVVFFSSLLISKFTVSKVVAKIKNKCYNKNKEEKNGRKEKMVEKP